MPDFEDLPLSVTSRVTHQTDFAFEKNNGEFANRLRSKFNTAKEAGPRIERISIDDDGDISIRTNNPEGGTWYVSASSVTIVGWLTSARKLRDTHGLDELGHTTESLYAERSQFQPELYDVRLFLFARSVPEGDFSAILSRSCGAAFGNIFTKGVPLRMSKGRISAEYQKDGFSDSVDFRISADGIELRYIRAALAEDFASYNKFLLSSDFIGVVDDIKPFAEMMKLAVPVQK